MSANFNASIVAALLVLSGLAGLSANSAYAHTFSTSESARFLSLTERIKAEIDLVVMNVADNNATLAQEHAEKAASLLNNQTLDELRERNNRIANSLETGLANLRENVMTLQGQIPQENVQNINQTVTSLDDLIAEAVSVRLEPEQQNNATTWAMSLANLTNVVLSNYGNATGAPYDLTNMSNLDGMEDHQMNGGNMSMDHESMSDHNNTMTMSETGSMDNTTAIVDVAAYQSAQYLVNSTIPQLFNDTLKPLTLSANNDTSASSSVTTNVDMLEENLIQLSEGIASKAALQEVMRTVHLGIHPLLIQLYGLTIEHEGSEEESPEGMGQ